MSQFSPDIITVRSSALLASLPPKVRLVAVSKKFSTMAIRAAYHSGIRDFGESQVQEAIQKQRELTDLNDIVWHFIGHLQRNKAKKAVKHFDWIHSVDSLKLAEHLNELCETEISRPNLCLQVKLRPDPKKFGWEPSNLKTDLSVLDSFGHLSIKGLMSIPPLGLEFNETLEYFQQARNLQQSIRQKTWQHLSFQELSIGMSNDYQIALKAGATMIRVGQGIFGARPTKEAKKLNR